jgi:hypothetical protein
MFGRAELLLWTTRSSSAASWAVSESAKKPRDSDVKDIGDYSQGFDRHVLLAGLDLVNVRTIKSGGLGKAILRKAPVLPELCNALADHSLNVVLQAIRLRAYPE